MFTPSAKQLTVISGRGKCSGGGGMVTIGIQPPGLVGSPVYPSTHVQWARCPNGVQKLFGPQGHFTQGGPQVLLRSSQYSTSRQSSSFSHSGTKISKGLNYRNIKNSKIVLKN